MLACFAAAVIQPPTLIAIVNPADGTAWRQDGSATDCPLSRQQIGTMSRWSDGSEPGTRRLFVFLRDRNKTDRQWDATPHPKTGEWKPLVQRLMEGGSDRFLVFFRELLSEKTAIDFSIAYTVAPRKTMIELSFSNGLASVVKGAEFHPGFFNSEAGLISASPKSDAGAFHRWRSPDLTAVRRFDWPYRDRLLSMDYVLRTSSQAWVAEAENLMVYEKEPPEHMLLAYRESISSFRRFTVCTQAFRKAEFRRVVVRPGMATGKP